MANRARGLYRQHKSNGTVNEAYWLTDFPRHRVSSRALFLRAKSRWEIENQGFNDAKNRHGFEHIWHHGRHSLLVVWLLTCLALTVERLYRIRYLHRGTHPVSTAIDLLLLFQLSLGRSRQPSRAPVKNFPSAVLLFSAYEFPSWHPTSSWGSRQRAKKRAWKIGADRLFRREWPSNAHQTVIRSFPARRFPRCCHGEKTLPHGDMVEVYSTR